MDKTKSPSPWRSGSFYLIAFIILLTALAVVGHMLPVIVLPGVIIGSIIALSVIGAFQMRQDDKLSQENFLKLMALSLKHFRWMKQQEEKPVLQVQDKSQP